MHRHKSIVGPLLLFAFVLLGLPAWAAGEKGVVNINSADAEQLALLPRVGPTVAQRIVEFREGNGRFKSTEELMLVRGIGERTYELLEPYVAIEGETTLTEKVPAPRSGSSSDSEG